MKKRAVFLVVAMIGAAVPLSPAVEPVDNVAVTMSVEGIPLKDVLKVLSEQTGFSYVASEDVENKKISLSFDNVPIRDALASIASANRLRFEQKRGSKVVLLYPLPEEAVAQEPTETRVFRLKYTRLSISPLDIGAEATIKDLGEAATLTTSSEGASSSSDSTAGAGIPSGLTAAKGIDRVVASLLTVFGKVTVDLHTNSLIVTDTPENLERITEVIEAVDKPSPQVLIEVYLMEVKKNILSDHGVDWGGANGALASFTGGSRTTGFPFQEKIFTESQGLRSEGTGAKGTPTLTLGTLSAANFAATLRLITSDARTHILARPRLLTLNNEAASIKLVTNTSIANTATQTAAEGQTTITADVAERTETGIILKLTPQINEDESIGLFVEPSITTVSTSSFFPSDFLDPTTRSVRTIARVRNNETLVIGGLLDRSDDTTYKKIPFLGDVPVLGYAFKYKDSSDLDRELLIFITPHIVGAGDAGSSPGWSDPSSQRLMDQFAGEEMQKQMDAFVNQQKKSLKALPKSAPPASPRKDSAATEMARTLDTFSRKK